VCEKLENFELKISKAWAKKRRLEKAIKKSLTAAALIGAAVVCAGFYNGDQVQVETVHKVQKGETLWSISEDYIKRNTGGRRYILEFKEGIKELNPWLVESKEQIQPGDKITIRYWVKKSEVLNR
jgi:nucleoid-associated protein YgaU